VIDDRDLFERSVQRFAPADGSFERLVTRRDRKQRNKRISAGVVALLLALVVIGAALRAIDVSRSTPVAPSPAPTASNGDISFVGSNLVDFSDDLSDFGILFVVNPAGGKPRKLLDTECPSDPDLTRSCGHVVIGSVDWSPDGTRIAYTLFEPGPGRSGEDDGVYVMEIETERIRRLTSCMDPCVRQDDIDWSPDGSRIAFAQWDREGCTPGTYDIGSCSIYTMKPDGSDLVQLPTGSVVDPVDPSWSPDGSSIAFSARVGEDWFVYTMALDGSEPLRLAADLPSIPPTQPAWSPDGATIAFLTGQDPDPNNGGPFALWSMRPDGSERRRLYDGCCLSGGRALGAQGPVWSPDGNQILIMQGTGGALQLIDPVSGEAFEIPTRKPTGAIAWQPVPLGSSSDRGALTFSFDPYDVNQMVYLNGVPVTGEMHGGQATDQNGLHSFYIFAPDRRIRVPTGASVSIEGADVLDVNADVAHGWIDTCCETSTLPRHLFEFDLANAPSMPSDPGNYYVDIRWTCATCDPETVIPFLFPVQVVAPEGR
jgi:Tol biopolymer transport system component